VLLQLARDLKAAFPDMGGFSRTNLYRVRAFYLAYKDTSGNVPQAVGQIPWGHNALLLEKIKDTPQSRQSGDNAFAMGQHVINRG